MKTPKQLRLKLGLSQKTLAAACNTVPGTVAKWDQKQREPSGPARRLLETLLWLKTHGLLDAYLAHFKEGGR